MWVAEVSQKADFAGILCKGDLAAFSRKFVRVSRRIFEINR